MRNIAPLAESIDQKTCHIGSNFIKRVGIGANMSRNHNLRQCHTSCTWRSNNHHQKLTHCKWSLKSENTKHPSTFLRNLWGFLLPKLYMVQLSQPARCATTRVGWNVQSCFSSTLPIVHHPSLSHAWHMMCMFFDVTHICHILQLSYAPHYLQSILTLSICNRTCGVYTRWACWPSSSNKYTTQLSPFSLPNYLSLSLSWMPWTSKPAN